MRTEFHIIKSDAKMLHMPTYHLCLYQSINYIALQYNFQLCWKTYHNTKHIIRQ